MMGSTEEKARINFTAARMDMMRESPFFSFLALSMRPVPTDRIKRIGVDARGAIYYNPEWLASLPRSYAKTAIAHELGHMVTETFTRGRGRDQKVWHLSTDQVWNEILQKNNFIPLDDEHGGWFFRYDLRGMTADEVYNTLEHEIPEECRSCTKGGNRGRPGEGQGGLSSGCAGGQCSSTFDDILSIDADGNVHDPEGNVIGEARDENGNPINGLDREKFQEQWKELIKEAEIFSKAEGRCPAGIGRAIDEIFRPRWSPRALLEKYITMDLAEQNWQFADKKKSGEIIFPAEREEDLVVGFAVDTSGSMNERELNICRGAIAHIFSICESVRVEVVECDAEKQDAYTVTRQGLRSFLRKTSFKGGGGTDYRPVIGYFNQKHPGFCSTQQTSAAPVLERSQTMTSYGSRSTDTGRRSPLMGGWCSSLGGMDGQTDI